jgi:hypothetical protein
MGGTVSKIIHFEDEDEFIDDMDRVLEAFSYLAGRYGHNPIEGIILWDSIGIQDRDGVKVFRVGEFPFAEGTLNLDLEEIRLLEKYFDELESKWDELSVEDIRHFVDLMNEALGKEMVIYEAYDLGLDRNTAYILLNIANIHYLDSILEGDDREIFESALELLLKYV